MKSITRLTMRLPGSTTNLGPGFDTLGLALGVYSTVTFELAPEPAAACKGEHALSKQPLVTLTGEMAQGLPTTKDNLIYKVFRENFPGGGNGAATHGASTVARMRVTIETDIPLARGLGSSSTAILAGLWAAQAFSSSAPPDRDQILAKAARLEGHPDNVAACLMGGFIISGYTQKGNRALTSRLNWPDKWHTLVVVPPYELSTAEARRVLPRRVSMAQAVNNVQRTGLVIGAVVNGDDDILREALSDQLHEPYRIHLVPELQALRRDLSSLPILGCVLSGAGSSSLVIVHEKHKNEIKAYLNEWAEKRQQKPQILDLTVDKKVWWQLMNKANPGATSSKSASSDTSTGTERAKNASLGNVSVLKFGGTSVKNLARILHVAEIVRDRLAEGTKILVVVSAMGDTTDYLLKLGSQCAKDPDRRELDSLLSTGEQISITLLAMTLKEMGIKSRSFTAAQIGIFTEKVHSKARIVDINSDNLARALQENDVLVVAGFQGITADGDITTLGRGGSDTTACALAAAIGAETCDIYTDVDGIYTADPNVIREARLLKRVSYGEVIEMARLGAQVLHPRAVELARQYKVRVRVRNTFKPDHEGTIIDGGEDMEIYRSISGVAVDKDQACVTIMDVPDKPGIAGQILQSLADNNIVIDMIMQAFHQTAGHNNITFTVPSTDLDQTIKILEAIKGDLAASSVIADEDIAKVSLIGAGLAGQSGIAATIFKAFGAAGINIKMIATSEMKLTCVVSGKDADKAGKIMHSSFGED